MSGIVLTDVVNTILFRQGSIFSKPLLLMFPFVLLLFFLIPLIEIYVLIQVGSVIGAGWTIALVVLTAVIGVQLLRQQGLSTMTRAQQKMQAGEMPAVEMLEGLALVLAGALLLTPGFFTDAIGFALLLPPIRQMLLKTLALRMVMQAHPQHRQQAHARGETIDDVNYRREDSSDSDLHLR